jgi:uncharacterized RDD family membrane protein YckC
MKNPPADKKRPERGRRRRPPTTAGHKGAPKAPPADEVVEEVPLAQATIWARITARSIDALLLLIPWYFLVSESFTVESETVTTRNDVFLWLTALLVVGYEAIFTGVWGWTPGKRVIGLAVVDPANGQSPPGWAKAVMRSTPLLLVVTLLLVPFLWLACVVAMYFDKRQRSVFDFTAGTAVVLAARSR